MSTLFSPPSQENNKHELQDEITNIANNQITNQSINQEKSHRYKLIVTILELQTKQDRQGRGQKQIKGAKRRLKH